MFHATGIIRKKRTPERERAYMEINASSQLPVENLHLLPGGRLHAKVKNMICIVTSCGNASISRVFQLNFAACRRIQAHNLYKQNSNTEETDENDQPWLID